MEFMKDQLAPNQRVFNAAAMNMDKNCTYTTRSNESVAMDVPTMIKFLQDLPKIPTILTMTIPIIRNNALPKGYVIISSNIADAFDEAIEGAKKKEKP